MNYIHVHVYTGVLVLTVHSVWHSLVSLSQREVTHSICNFHVMCKFWQYFHGTGLSPRFFSCHGRRHANYTMTRQQHAEKCTQTLLKVTQTIKYDLISNWFHMFSVCIYLFFSDFMLKYTFFVSSVWHEKPFKVGCVFFYMHIAINILPTVIERAIWRMGISVRVCVPAVCWSLVKALGSQTGRCVLIPARLKAVSAQRRLSRVSGHRAGRRRAGLDV